MTKVRLKIAKVRKGESDQVKDLEVRSTFKLASVDDEWRLIEQGYMETCEQVLGRAKPNRKEWISKETWDVIEQQKVAKKHHEHGQNEKAEERCKQEVQELNREVKRRCRRDRRV